MESTVIILWKTLAKLSAGKLLQGWGPTTATTAAMRAFAAGLGRATNSRGTLFAATPLRRISANSEPRTSHEAGMFSRGQTFILRSLTSTTKAVQPAAASAVDAQPGLAPPPLPHGRGDLTPAIRCFFDATEHDHPVLAVDLSVVEWGYRALASALPNTDIYYAVKANPAGEILDR